jgi:hypothetical protein
MSSPPFEDIYETHEVMMLLDAHAAITECNLWEWLRTYTPHANEGFMFAVHPNLDAINLAMRYEGHSGSSYGWTMRVMESIAKHGWDEHVRRYLRSK